MYQYVPAANVGVIAFRERPKRQTTQNTRPANKCVMLPLQIYQGSLKYIEYNMRRIQA